MCGIIGAFVFRKDGESFLTRINDANEVLAKRGPDGGGMFNHHSIVLGHRRLSIIDVSCAGDQPMHSHDGRYTIIFNGEIFNYKELQKKYLTNDEQRELKSHSDTEVFLFIY